MTKAISILIAVILISAIAMLLYPTVSDQYSQFLNNRRILSYTRQVEAVDPTAGTEMMAAARAYNEVIRNTDIKDAFDAAATESSAEYQSLLNPNGDGIMGIIEIPRIGVRLPVYHGTGDVGLSQGAGHMEGTSLPVGGENTHCGIAGHRGLPSAKLFSDLDQIQRGDVIYLNVLGELLVYQVDQISVVLPHEMEYMSIIEGGDYLTLVTCTPYGVNSHRLLVRGVRSNLEDLVDVLALGDSAERTPDWQGALVCAAPVFAVGLLLMLLIRPKRKYGLKNPKR
ncbi:MAG: class C sortase [Clostridia bacterium]|nr:class C sortase [Clostridia bacterium]